MHDVLAQGARDLVVTRGARGVLVTTGGAIVDLPASKADVVDVTGAGDAFAAAVCWSLVQDDGADDLVLACRRGLHLSALTLGVPETVHPGLGPDSLATEHPLQTQD
jgi:pseudouridine kinase